MQETTPVRAQFRVDVSQAEYVQASLLLARRFGVLQFAPAAMIAGVLLIAGSLTMTGFMISLFFPLFLLLLGILLLVVFLVVEPADIRRQQRRITKPLRSLCSRPIFVCARMMYGPKHRIYPCRIRMPGCCVWRPTRLW